jgi:hypothetical protein
VLTYGSTLSDAETELTFRILHVSDSSLT